MKGIARLIVIGMMGLLIFTGACSKEEKKDYSKNFAKINDAPVGFYDVAKYEKGVFTGIGWSADKEDGAPLKKVLVYVDGELAGEAEVQIDRPDVAKTFNNDKWLRSGWTMSVKIPLSKGPHSTMALSYDSEDALRVTMLEFKVE